MRDHYGRFLAGLSSSMEFSSQPIIFEFQALLRAMEFCVKLDFERVKFKCDALILINTIKREEACWAWYGNLIEDVQQILKNRSL